MKNALARIEQADLSFWAQLRLATGPAAGGGIYAAGVLSGSAEMPAQRA